MRGSLVVPSSLVAYGAPVSPSLFGVLWISLIALGIAFMGWFFVYEVSVIGSRRDVRKELSLASISSILLGFGVMFLMLWAGVWV